MVRDPVPTRAAEAWRWARSVAPRAMPVGAPIALVACAAAIPALRLPVLILLATGLVAGRGDPVLRSAWAAPLPIAVSLAWGLVPAPLAAADGSDCASPLSPVAAWRLSEAALALAALAVVARWLPSTRAELGLRRTSGRLLAAAALGALVVGPVAVVVGPTVGRPFFGAFALATGDLGAVVPALIFAVSNGTMEELAYRGALQGWLGRLMRPRLAIAAQAVVFGLAHAAGPDFVGSPLPVVAAMIGAGVVAGAIVRRTGSLALPLVIHVAFDVPLYYYWACRFA